MEEKESVERIDDAGEIQGETKRHSLCLGSEIYSRCHRCGRVRIDSDTIQSRRRENLDSPSLDRIDSTKGYTPENVRVVLYCINVMANIWGENKIVEMSEAIMRARR